MTTTSDMARLLMMQGTALPDAGLGPVTNTTRAGRPNPMLTAPPNQERPADYMHPVAELLSLPMGAYGAGQLVGSGVNAMRDEDYASGAGQFALGMAGMLPMAPKGGKGIRAFHGSPHDFERFDMSKIGTGEGAQAYGHGLYFAEAEDVAKTYREPVTGGWGGERFTVNGLDEDQLPIHVRQAVAFVGKEAGDGPLDAAAIEKALQGARAAVKRYEASKDPSVIRHNLPHARDTLRGLEEIKGAKLGRKQIGHMYEVNIKADPQDFLDWDKPLSQQSEKVREAALSAMERSSGGITRNDLKEGVTGADAVRYGGLDDPNAMTKALREAGIPGIRYLDQMSRGEGKGSSNYVVFDDALVEILRKYGLLGPVAGGGTLAGMLMGGQEGETY